MSADYGDISRLLDRAKRRRSQVILAAAAASGLAVALAAVLAGAAVLALGARADREGEAAELELTVAGLAVAPVQVPAGQGATGWLP